MTLHVDSGTLGLLYGPRMKLVVAAADESRARDLQSQEGDDPADPGLVLFHPATDREPPRVRAIESPETADLAPLPAPPSGLCVLAALSPQGRTQLKELIAWWNEYGATCPPTLLDLAGTVAEGPVARQAALYRELSRVALHEVTRGAERESELTGELYELRVLQEQGRNAIESMQQAIDRLQKVPCHLMHELVPDGTTYRPLAPEATTVVQKLAVGAEGLAGFDLYSLTQLGGSAGKGFLQITLRARESSETLGAWTFDYEDLGRGWVRCSFPTALTVPLHHLEVAVSWHTVAGEAPELGLSSVHPWHELRATVDGQPLEKALALLVWAAVPGAKVGASKTFWTPAEGGTSRTEFADYRIAPEDFHRVQPTTAESVQALTILPDRPGFRLHPLGSVPVCAALHRACLPGTARLVATVQINNHQAKFPVDYAMCLTDAAARCVTFPTAPENDPRVVGFSGWQPVPPDQLPHAVTLELPKPLGGAADLHFATRMKEGQVVWYHWADWIDLRTRLRLSA